MYSKPGYENHARRRVSQISKNRASAEEISACWDRAPDRSSHGSGSSATPPAHSLNGVLAGGKQTQLLAHMRREVWQRPINALSAALIWEERDKESSLTCPTLGCVLDASVVVSRYVQDVWTAHAFDLTTRELSCADSDE